MTNEPQSSNLSRRQTLQVGAGIAAMIAAGVSPSVLHAEDKAGGKPIVYGRGAHTYEVIDNWAKRPEDKPWGDTHMVQELADGRILIHHNGPDSVHEYDPDGKFIKAWGDEFKGAAHGMDLRTENGEELLYFAATKQHRVVKTNTKGEHVFELKYPKDARNAEGQPCYADEKKFVPTFVALAPGGDFYVTDGYGSNYVHRYSLKGQYISTFGGKGTADGQLSCPHGIYCDTRDPNNPTILVADRANHRLQWFSLEGKHLKTTTEDLRDPCHFDQQGTEILIPDLKGRISIFDKDNQLVVHLGDNPDPSKRRNHKVPKEALAAGDFCTPHGAIWDRAGNIYVTEWLPYGRVTKLRKVSA